MACSQSEQKSSGLAGAIGTVETKPIDIVRLVGTAAACVSEAKKDRLASW